MRYTMQALALAAAAVLAIEVRAAGVQDASQTAVQITGAPAGSALELALNGGKIADGTPSADGTANLVATIGSETRQRVTVWVDVCKDNKIVRVQLVLEGGAEPPKDEDCDRKLAGWFWSNARSVRVNVRTGTVETSRRLSNRNLAILGGAAAGGALLLGGSGDSNGSPNTPNNPGNQNGNNPPPFNPAGNYLTVIVVRTDPGGHRPFIELMQNGTLVVTGSSTLSIAGPSGSNWVTVTGPFNTSTNQFALAGSGTVAGRSNVGVRFNGTIMTNGALSGDYTMGVNGELPGGQAIVYGVTGQRQ